MTRDGDAPSTEAPAPGGAAHRLLVGGVLVLGAFLRLYGFDQPGLWIDEYGTWWVVAADSWSAVAARAWEIQGQSPLYYLIVRGSADLFGFASASLRGPSLVFGILALWLGYRAARALFRDSRVALMATAALALHPLLIRYAQEARPYSLALALSLGCFALFVRVLRGTGLGGRAAHALTTAGSFYAHYLFGFAWLVQAGYALVQRGRIRREALGSLAAAALLMAPGGLQLANLFGRRETIDWVPDDAPVLDALFDVARSFVDFGPLALAAGAVAALRIFGAGTWRPEPGDRPGLVLAWLLVPFAGIGLAAALLDLNLIHDRYLLSAVPAVCIGIGALLAVPRRTPLADALPLLLFTGATIFQVLLPHHARTGTFADRKDQRWDTAVAEMLAAYREGDRVLLATRFVELDLVVAGEAGPATRAFVTWPLEAHLPPGARVPYTPLPYSLGRKTRPAFERIVRQAFTADRVWVLGAGPAVDAIARRAEADPRIRFARRDDHGSISLMLLVRADGAGTDPGRSPPVS